MDLFWGEDGRLRSGWRFLLSVIVYVFLNGFAVDLANAWAGASDRKFELFYRPVLLIFLLIGFSILLKTLDRVDGNPLVAMGLGSNRILPDSLIGLGIGAVMVGLAVLVMATAYHVGFLLVLNKHSLKLGLAVLLILATGAMAEEVTFRGYPFQRLVEGAGPVAAIVLSSALFGSLHLRNPHASVFGMINTIAIGIVLAIAYLRSRSLWLAWGLHFGWNVTLGLLFGLPVSGIQQFGVVVKGVANGPTWLTGGAYGVEGGAAGTLAIVAGLAVTMFGLKSRQIPPVQALEQMSPDGSAVAGIQVSHGNGAHGAD